MVLTQHVFHTLHTELCTARVFVLVDAVRQQHKPITRRQVDFDRRTHGRQGHRAHRKAGCLV